MLRFIGVLLVLAAAGYLIWHLRYPTYTYRFRMTVEVNTPEGVTTGTSVYEVRARKVPKLLPEHISRKNKVRGEAVAVDLSDGRAMFALLKTSAHWGDMESLSMNTLHPDFSGTGYDLVGVAKELSKGMHKGPTEVAPADYPMLVTFADLGDPTSVKVVDPADLAASFGEGVSLKRIVVELTDDPVTTGIEERLPAPSDKGFYGIRVQVGGEEKIAVLGRWEFSKGVQQ